MHWEPNAPMTELVYVLVLEAKFCEFESRLGHQIFYAPLVKWILHNATNVEVGVWFSQGAPVLKWDFSWYGYSGGLKSRWSWFDSNRSYQVMEDDAGALVRRLALKTRFSEMGWGSTPPSSAKIIESWVSG